MGTARNKVRQLAAQGRSVEEIDRALAGEGLTDLERDVACLLAAYEVRRGSSGRRDSPDAWEDEREIWG